MEMQGTPPSFIERFFKVREKGSTLRTELLAGMTTFIAMAYILFVNPNILADAGIPKEAAIASTIWIAALASIAMGTFANYPVALAPGMGLNAFFAYYVCGVLGLHWTVALGAVFFSGVLFLILTIGGIRQAIINAVPRDLKLAISVGIGLFIAFIGLKGTGLIVENAATYVSLGHVTAPTTLLSLFGLLFTAALMARNSHRHLCNDNPWNGARHDTCATRHRGHHQHFASAYGRNVWAVGPCGGMALRSRLDHLYVHGC